MSSQQCHLLSGTFAIIVQGFLGSLCVIVLVTKRHYEIPQRDWFIWGLDVVKQGLSSTLSHFSNILLSIIIASRLANSDECQWYCVAYTADSVIGTGFNFFFVRVFEYSMNYFPNYKEYLKFGHYGDPPTLYRWLPQVGIWLIIVTIGKCLVLTILISSMLPINSMISYIFKSLHHNPKLELIIVMIVIPTILNSIQFWLTDAFLKSSHSTDELLSNDSSGHSSNGGDISVELLRVS